MDAVYQLFISSSTVFNKPLKIFRKAVELCRGSAYNNNMEKEVQNRITADIAAFRLPRYAQIPEVGLYLEQVVRYINARLAPLGEPELTGSMVSTMSSRSWFLPLKKSCIQPNILRGFCSSRWSSLLFLWRGFD